MGRKKKQTEYEIKMGELQTNMDNVESTLPQVITDVNVNGDINAVIVNLVSAVNSAVETSLMAIREAREARVMAEFAIEDYKDRKNLLIPAQVQDINEAINKKGYALLCKYRLKGTADEKHYLAAIYRMIKSQIKSSVGVHKWEQIKGTDYERIMKSLIPQMDKYILREDVIDRAQGYAKTEYKKLSDFVDLLKEKNLLPKGQTKLEEIESIKSIMSDAKLDVGKGLLKAQKILKEQPEKFSQFLEQIGLKEDVAKKYINAVEALQNM